MAEDGEVLKLDSLQHDLLLPQIQAFLEATSDPAARETYGALKDAVERLEIPPELAARLGAIIEVALSSGRVRRLFGPGAELSLSALFNKTPRGKQLAQSVAELNSALGQLQGQSVENVSVTIRTPGVYAMTIRTPSCQLAIRFAPEEARVETFEVDLK